MANRYKKLQVNYFDPETAIRAAHRTLARKNHPDVNGSDKAADMETALLNDARDVLVRPAERFAHDLELLAEVLPFHPIVVTATATKMAGIPPGVVFAPREMWEIAVRATLTAHDMFFGRSDLPRLGGESKKPVALLAANYDVR